MQFLDVITDSYLLKPREQNKILLVFIHFLDIIAYCILQISGSYNRSKSVVTMKTGLQVIPITGAAPTTLGQLYEQLGPWCG
jgi:hypothetical protein